MKNHSWLLRCFFFRFCCFGWMSVGVVCCKRYDEDRCQCIFQSDWQTLVVDFVTRISSWSCCDCFKSWSVFVSKTECEVFFFVVCNSSLLCRSVFTKLFFVIRGDHDVVVSDSIMYSWHDCIDRTILEILHCVCFVFTDCTDCLRHFYKCFDDSDFSVVRVQLTVWSGFLHVQCVKSKIIWKTCQRQILRQNTKKSLQQQRCWTSRMKKSWSKVRSFAVIRMRIVTRQTSSLLLFWRCCW